MPKVLVLRNDDAVFRLSTGHHVPVGKAWRILRDDRDVVPGRPERQHDGEVATLVRKEQHGVNL